MTKLGAKLNRIYTDRDMAASIQDTVNKTPGMGDADAKTLSVQDVKNFMEAFKADPSFQDAFHEGHFGYDGVPEFVALKAADRIIEDIPKAMERGAFEAFSARLGGIIGRLGFLSGN
jgi:hypothetical protein